MLKFDNERYIQTLSEMIQIKTIAKSDDIMTTNVKEFHEYIIQRFPNLMKVSEKIDEFDGGLMIRWIGKDSSKKPLVLMSHLDVVDAKGDWKFNAFGGEVSNDYIHGRGSVDTKGSLCAFYEACEKLVKEGFKPKSDIYLLSSSREEIAGKDAVLMAKYFKDNNITPALLIDEGGAVMEKPLPILKSSFAMIAMSERSSIKILVTGEQKDILKFKKKIQKAKLDQCILPSEVEEMVKRMAPKMMFPFNLLLRNFKLVKGMITNILPKISKQAGAMVVPSANLTEENDKTYLKIACTYYHNIDKIIENANKIADKHNVNLEVDNIRRCPRPTDFNHDQVKLVEQTVLDTFPNTTPTPFIIFGGTDARHFVDVCDCVVRFAPLIMNNEIISTIHNANEKIFTKSIGYAVKYYYNLITNFNNAI